jgi:hypothetical protein
MAISLLLAAVASVGSPVQARPAQLSADQLEELVLQQSDVGAAYFKNRSFTRRRTFAEASNGDSPAVSSLLKILWKGGYQSGFNGRSVPWGISSTADLFVNSNLDSIVSAWHADVRRLASGQRLSVPSTAPGTRRFLVRGRVRYHGRTIHMMIYMWQEKRVVASVTIAGEQTRLPLSTLLSFARTQDRKIRRNTQLVAR